MKLNSIDLIRIFSNNLFLTEKGNQVYIMDRSKLGDMCSDYGVYMVVSKEDILSGDIDLDYIPDMYIEDYMNFMLHDDLKHHYCVSDSVIAKLSECALDEWYPVLKKECTNAVISDLQYLERISSLTSGQTLDAMTEEELEAVLDQSERVKDYVNAYERKLKVQEEMLEYIETLFYQHDMAAWRNNENLKRQQRVANKCMETLQKHPDLFDTLESKQQIRYFVRQTILYMT